MMVNRELLPGGKVTNLILRKSYVYTSRAVGFGNTVVFLIFACQNISNRKKPVAGLI